MTGETLLTPAGDTTTGADDENVDANTDVTKTDETVVDRYDADGNKTDDGTFDQHGKEIKDESDDDKSGDDKDKDDKSKDKVDDEESKGAPEAYDDFTLPEGIEINDDDLAEFHEIAKELNLDQNQAQKLVDLQSKRAESMAENFNSQLQDAFNKQQDDWLQELKDDKDFGGDNLDKNVGLAVKVINKFGTPELKATLDSSGMGNNPEVIKMLNSIGKAISEDSLEDDHDNNSGSEVDIADKLYPNQGK